MVFTTVVNFVRSKGPDEFWRKRKILKLSAHFFGRRRNCYDLAIRGVNRAMQYATKNRELRKEDLKELWTQRITAGIEQHGLDMYHFRDALQKSNILLNNKALSELAAWEPATFESIAKIAKDVKDKEAEDQRLEGASQTRKIHSKKFNMYELD